MELCDTKDSRNIHRLYSAYVNCCLFRKVSAVPVAGGKLRADEIFQEIKKTVDAVSPLAYASRYQIDYVVTGG